jgi:hypothetical protein
MAKENNNHCFVSSSEVDLLNLLEKGTPIATKNSRKVWMNIYLSWYKEKT